MKQIAAKAGVSLGTVSHVLNNTANVSDRLRQRVREAVAELEYQPSELARGLRREKTNMIGMVIPDITNPFFPRVVRGAEDVAFANGYRLVLCNTDNNHSKEIVHLTELRTYRPAGLIVIPSNFSELSAQAQSYRKAGTAVVCIDRMPLHWKGDTVTVSNEEGAYRATHHLIQLGHRRLATITGPLHLTNAQQRLAGFKRAVAQAGLTVSPEYIQETTFDKLGGHAKTCILFRLVPAPTAIFAGNDMIALGVLTALRDLGLCCPQDVSLIGFDDLDIAEMTNPQLSSVYQPGYQLGETAARLLLERVAGSTSPAKHLVLETQLKIRQSVSPPPETTRPKAARRSALERRSATSRRIRV